MFAREKLRPEQIRARIVERQLSAIKQFSALALGLGVQLGGVLREKLSLGEQHHAAGGQMVEERHRMFAEERPVKRTTLETLTGLKPREGGFPLGASLAAQGCADEGLHTGNGRSAPPERQFVRRANGGNVEASGAALGGRVKLAQIVQFIAEEFEAQGQHISGRPDINQIAPAHKFTGLFDCGGVGVAQVEQAAQQQILAQPLTAPQTHRRRLKFLAGQRGLKQRFHGGDEHQGRGCALGCRAHAKILEDAQTLADHLAAGGHMLVGQRIAGGEEQHSIRAKPLAQILGGAQGCIATGQHVDDRGCGRTCQGGDHRRARCHRERRDLEEGRAVGQRGRHRAKGRLGREQRAKLR